MRNLIVSRQRGQFTFQFVESFQAEQSWGPQLLVLFLPDHVCECLSSCHVFIIVWFVNMRNLNDPGCRGGLDQSHAFFAVVLKHLGETGLGRVQQLDDVLTNLPLPDLRQAFVEMLHQSLGSADRLFCFNAWEPGWFRSVVFLFFHNYIIVSLFSMRNSCVSVFVEESCSFFCEVVL